MRRARRLGHRSLQGALAATAIAVAVALPVVLLSVGGGVSDHELASLERAGYQIAVSAPGLHGVTGAHALSVAIAGLTTVRAASPILSAPVDAFGPSGGPLPGLAEGIIPTAFQATEGPEERAILPTNLALGDPSDTAFFDGGRYDGPPANVVLLSAPFASSLSLHVGGMVYLAPAPDRAAALPFRIAGEIGVPGPTLGPIAAYALLLPLSELQLVSGFARANGTSGSLIDAADTVQVALAGASATSPSAVARAASAIGALVPYYGVSTFDDQIRATEQASSILTGFYLALSSVGLAVGLLFLAIVLVRWVELERRALGIRKAIGVPRGQLARLVVRRAVVLASEGAAGGIVGGWAIILALQAYGSPTIQAAVRLAEFNALMIGELALGLLGLAILSSLAAVRAVLRLPLAEALR